MALRMGIGDVFTLCKSAVDVCSRAIHEEHEGTSTLITEMKQIRTHLKSLEAQIGDEKAFVKTRPELAPIIKRSLEPLHRDLSDLKATLYACSGPRKTSIHVVDQVRYLVLYKAKLDGFQSKLPTHRASIAVIQDLIECQTPNGRRESVLKLNGIVENQERDFLRAAGHEKMQNRVISIFEERMSSQLSGSDGKIDHVQLLESLEDDLLEEGIEREYAAQTLFPITKALLRQPILPTGEKRSILPNLEFKLDLFDIGRRPKGAYGNEIDGSRTETQIDMGLAPDENVDDLECRL